MATAVGLFDSYDDATRAVSELEAKGIAHGDISLVANNADNRAHATDSNAGTGAGVGAGLGGVAGGTAGLLAGLGLLAIPGVGPVVAAGWLVATAAGAAVGATAGAATGGIVGAMTDAGVHEDHAHVYAEGVRRGGTLVTARVDDGGVAAAEAIMQRNHAVDREQRAAFYRNDGWTKFDHTAPPYAPSDVERVSPAR
jgi:hypothetical protein